jgi:hypothetical protein
MVTHPSGVPSIVDIGPVSVPDPCLSGFEHRFETIDGVRAIPIDPSMVTIRNRSPLHCTRCLAS